MRAVVYTQYGPPDVLRIAEVENPAPTESQVLVKVYASSINAQEYRVRQGKPFLARLMIGGLLKPKNSRIGSDFAGLVSATGKNVTQFQPGDEVFGVRYGALAEYVCAGEGSLASKPANLSFEQAAAVPVAAITALQAIRHAGGVEAGQKVLVQGASGGVGTYTVQLAKASGAEVTAVCSPRNLDMARSLGADHVIDYTKDDFTRKSRRYDLILAINGYHPLHAYRRALNPQGIYVCAGGTIPQVLQAMLFGSLMSRDAGRKMSSMGIARVKQEDLVFLTGLLEAGKVRPVVDRVYPLSEVVEAFRYVEETHAQGKVVVDISKG